MSTTEATPETNEDFVIRIPKKLVKRIAAVGAATAAVVGAVFVARNLSIETDETSVTVELEKD